MKQSVHTECCGVEYCATIGTDRRWRACHRCSKALRWPDERLTETEAMDIEQRERKYRDAFVKKEKPTKQLEQMELI